MKLYVLSRKDAVLIAVVTDIALHTRDGAAISPDIGARLNVSHRYFVPFLTKLARAGILVGKAGPGGGYELARDPHLIKVGDILQAVEEPQRETQFVRRRGATWRGRRIAHQLVSRAVTKLDELAWARIRDLTIAQLLGAD
jgi:Rrf2 family protein